MISKEDKKEHPIFYWAFLVLLALCAFQLFSIAIGEVHADTFPIGTGTLIEDQPNVGYPGSAMAAGVRQLNGTLWHFSIEYTDGTHRAILANYSNDNGDIWDGFEIMDETETEFGGTGFPYVVHDAVVMSNNSIIVLVDLYAYDTINKHELHLLCHWNNSDFDQWEQITIYSHVTYYPDIDFASMCINSTDIILVAYERTPQNYIHHDKFNPTTRTVTTGSHLGISATSIWGPWALVNSSDTFIIAYPYNDGLGQDLYFKKESDWSAITDQSFGSGYGPTDVIVALDDTFIFTHLAHAGPGWFYLRYWNATGSGVRKVASTAMYNTALLGLSNQSDRWILVSNYDHLNDRMSLWSANYSSSETHWQTTQAIYFVETSDVIDYTSWMPHALYPILKDYQTLVENHTQIPLGGAFLYFVDTDDPGYDFYNWKTTIMTWPGIAYWTYDPDWTVGPEITTSGLDEGTYGELYSFGMSRSGGTAPFEWTLVSGPVWLEIGLATGILSGTPTGSGTFVVEIQLADVIPRFDTEIFNLKIKSAVTEGFSAEDLELASLWTILATAAIGVGLAREFKRFTHKKQ